MKQTQITWPSDLPTLETLSEEQAVARALVEAEIRRIVTAPGAPKTVKEQLAIVHNCTVQWIDKLVKKRPEQGNGGE